MKIREILLNELKKGTSREELSRGISVGILIGIFPLLGFTTFLAFLAGVVFKLNQVLIQTVNYLLYPLQLILIPIYIKLAITLFPAISPFKGKAMSVGVVLEEFKAAPLLFLKNFGAVGLIGVLFWILLAAVLYPCLCKGFVYFLKKKESAL